MVGKRAGHARNRAGTRQGGSGAGARLRLDLCDRNRLRPARRQLRVGHIDARGTGCRTGCRAAGDAASKPVAVLADVLVPVPADTQQALLQFAVACKLARGQDAVDAAVDHDRDVFGDRAGHADVLLDDEDVHVALLTQLLEHLLDLGHDDRRKSLRRLVHDKQPRVGEQRPRDRQHLLLATGELPAAIRFALGQARERRVDPIDRPRALAPPIHEPQVLVDRQRRPQPPALRHISDAELGDVGRRKADERLPGEADRTARRPAPGP